ncbi:hypothetical protein, partial [Paramuribaculum intestinale]|uniref:hypothetical protein n=1 Tax=Paramuribaculum intestinale TaxID=2094151 RepID=UPI003F73AEBD
CVFYPSGTLHTHTESIVACQIKIFQFGYHIAKITNFAITTKSEPITFFDHIGFEISETHSAFN